MRNHFAETPAMFYRQMSESFNCSTNPYFYLVGHAIDDATAQEKIHDVMRKATELFDLAFQWIAEEMAKQGDDADVIADASEMFHQKVAEEGQFAAVPYDPS